MLVSVNWYCYPNLIITLLFVGVFSVFRVLWPAFEFCIVSSVLLLVPHGMLLLVLFMLIFFFLPLWNIYFCSAIIDMITTSAEKYWVYWVRSVILLFFISSPERVLNHFCQVSETNPVWILGLSIYINLGKITVFAKWLPVTDKIHNFKQNKQKIMLQ